MANGHGGPRTPSSPAPVSGPGALSKRTDGGPGAKQPVRVPTGGAYGDATQLAQAQAGAPMAASPGGDQPTHSLLAGLSRFRQGRGFGAPSYAAGHSGDRRGRQQALAPGPEALGLPAQQDQDHPGAPSRTCRSSSTWRISRAPARLRTEHGPRS
jgi:hypothetical protein